MTDRSADSPGRTGLWTIPNILSLLRVLLIPFFLWAMTGRRPLAALLLFSAAGLTDFLDGLAARFLRQRTKLGLILDPAADKLLMTAGFIACTIPSLSVPNMIPLGLTMLVVARDAAIAAGALVLRKRKARKNFVPSLWGKASTVCQVACLFLVLLFNALGVRTAVPLAVTYVLTASATVISGGHYFWLEFLKEYRRSPDRPLR